MRNKGRWIAIASGCGAAVVLGLTALAIYKREFVLDGAYRQREENDVLGRLSGTESRKIRTDKPFFGFIRHLRECRTNERMDRRELRFRR